jgi:PAS domain S-box-containing protein
VANILIVEDEHIVAWDIKETLERLGHKAIYRVVSAEEAIQAAEIEAPDLVLMDIRLAGEMDGIAAGNEIYHQLDIPVVYLTAHADELTLKRATCTNPFGYIIKPFQAQTLQSTIQIALQRHQLESSTHVAQAYLAQALDSIGGGIIVTDRFGVITLMNPLAESLTGWQEQAAIGKEIGEVFKLIWESDATPIENPSLRAMRLQQPVKSPEKCWLVSKDGEEIPIYDTATPIFNPDGEIVGSVVMFQDNTDRILAMVDLWEERNQELENFQIKFISQLQQKTAQHKQAIACIQVLNRVLKSVRTATSEYEILNLALQALGTAIDVDYCWVALHDRQHATARIICEYASADRLAAASLLGQEIDLELYPQFYQHLCQPQHWIEPPRSIVPSLYLNSIAPGSQLLVCAIAVEAENDEREREWTIGEVGIVSTGKPTWMPAQATLIAQIFSYAIKLFRHARVHSIESHSIERSWEWLGSLEQDFTSAIDRAEQDLKTSAAILQQQIHILNIETSDADTIEHHQFLHRELLASLEIVKVEWQQQFNLIDTLIEFHQNSPTSPLNFVFSQADFCKWIDAIASNCEILAKLHHQSFNYKISADLPSLLVGNFPVLESIVMDVVANACKYTPALGFNEAAVPQTRSILMDVHIQANQLLKLSIVNIGMEIPPTELATIFLPFAQTSPDRIWQHGGTSWGLALVKQLLPYLGGEIQATSSSGATSLIITVPI